MTATLLHDEMMCYASVNLEIEWKCAYMKAMGRDERDDFPHESTVDNAPADVRITLVNLVPEAINNNVTSTTDMWMQTALQIQQNIDEMSTWLQKKKWDYVSVTMPDSEASLIQSTVTSFTCSTANEIESLRSMSLKHPSSMKQQHEQGIVHILMAVLKETVADPFGKLQKQRSRKAVSIWQNPLGCHIVNNATFRSRHDDDLDAALGLSSSNRAKEQRFLPSRPNHRMQQDFLSAYKQEFKRKRPDSFFDCMYSSKKQANDHFSQHPQEQEYFQQPTQRRTTTKSDTQSTFVQDSYANEHELLQEAALLTVAVNNDLDVVHQVEQRMVDITTLLSQFASLVQEQQEFVVEIHDATIDAKENVAKGQENLIDATERTASSKHYMASGITAMGVFLLILHWVVP
jgi:hypothetical protein